MLSYFKLSEEHVLSPDPRWLVELERRDRQWFGRAWSDGEYPLPQMQALRVKPRQIEQLHHIIRHWEATALTRDDAPISPWNLVYRLDGKAIHKTGFAHPSTWNQLVWLCFLYRFSGSLLSARPSSASTAWAICACSPMAPGESFPSPPVGRKSPSRAPTAMPACQPWSSWKDSWTSGQATARMVPP